MHDLLKIGAALEVEHRVNVIRHHAPRVKVVANAIEVLQGTSNDGGIAILTQDAAAVSCVEVRIEAKGEHAIRFCALRGIHCCSEHVLALLEQCLGDGLWQ
jgi:hypothetical protein